MRFGDVVGQTAAKQQLLRSVAENRVPHALLLSGAEGVGGLALAMAFVQYMVCRNRTSEDSCGVCPMCRKLEAVRLLDLHLCLPLISGAGKEDAVQDIHGLMRTFVKEVPYASEMDWYERLGDATKQGNISAKVAEDIIGAIAVPGRETDYRFMVVWLPERLHPVAANRLLKVVEEPPQGAHFIFVSHHPEDILPTIFSRLQQIVLLPPSVEEIAEALSCEGCGAEAASQIARIARGNYRAALNMAKSQGASPYLPLLIDLYRMAYGVKVANLSGWVERTAKCGREEQKAMLRYFSMMLREIYMLNLGQESLCYLMGEELQFARKVAPYISGRNVGYLLEEYTRALRHVIRNGHGGLIFTDLAINHFRLINSKRI